MRPLRIEITNFGAIPHAVIDLTGVNVASICGPNGAGKSTAITIAPMFALFGSTKGGCSVDDMVRTGATEATVTFDFKHHGDVWRVIRTRSTKGKGKSTLELQRQSGELWATESGASIAETQKKIIRLLNLDEETFSSSSMILQGRANEFTARPTGQRKAILAQILQLEQYETLQEKARAKVQEVNVSLEKCKAKVADIDSRLTAKPSLEGEKLAVEIEIASLESSLKELESNLQALQVEYSTLLAKIQQADEIGRQAKVIRDDISVKTLERDRQQSRLDTAEQLLRKEQDILDKAAEYDEIREQVTVLKTKKSQQDEIFAEATRLKQELSEVIQSLESVTTKIENLESDIADRPQLEQDSREYQKAVADLADYQQLREQDTQRRLELANIEAKRRTVESTYLTQRTSKLAEIKRYQHTAAMLHDAQCVDIEKAQCRFLADAKEAKQKAEQLQQAFDSWELEQRIAIDGIKSQEAAANNAVNAVGYDSSEYTRLQKLVVDLKPKADLFAQMDGMITVLENLREQRTGLENRRDDLNTRLKSARDRYRDLLSDSLKLLPELENKLNVLAPWIKSKEQLPVAREAATTAKEQIAKLNTEIDDLTLRVSAMELEYTTISSGTALKKLDLENRLKSAQDSIKLHRENHTLYTSRLGGIQAKLDSLAQDEEQRLTLVVEMEPLAKQLTHWQKLVKAFGRDGIPALIIENAVPELERIANDILGQMSGGKNFLRFETQRELKSGKGMAETLDIIVGDYAGERIYETFSGGEQLRIDFAIRFALAELLARRAGARVDWLTIDEGFGSQSDEYLPAVIDAVKSVANRFGLVLVISHVKAVQEAFEQKIYFRPTTDGVEVQVV